MPGSTLAVNKNKLLSYKTYILLVRANNEIINVCYKKVSTDINNFNI